jgi:signal peptidase I
MTTPVSTARRAAGVLTVTAGAATVLVWARRRFMLITVRGTSMTPTYADGERLLLRRGGYATGDVVVFRSPMRIPDGMKWLVKRVAAMPGDPVPADMAGRTPMAVVPPGRLLVRSDAVGLDSRQLGLIEHHDVLGKVCTARPAPVPRSLPCVHEDSMKPPLAVWPPGYDDRWPRTCCWPRSARGQTWSRE